MIHVSSLGVLHPHPIEPDLLESEPMQIPFLEGNRLPVELLELSELDEIEVEKAMNAFVGLTGTDRNLVAHYLWRNYQNHLVSRPFLPGVTFREETSAQVWNRVRFYAVIVSRRPQDGLIYVDVMGECDWDRERGIQIVFKQGNVLVRVSRQDGHLTHADAFNLPGLDIISEPSREEMRMIIDRKRRYPDGIIS